MLKELRDGKERERERVRKKTEDMEGRLRLAEFDACEAEYCISDADWPWHANALFSTGAGGVCCSPLGTALAAAAAAAAESCPFLAEEQQDESEVMPKLQFDMTDELLRRGSMPSHRDSRENTRALDTKLRSHVAPSSKIFLLENFVRVVHRF
jgi:hypothetical protein